MNSNSKELSLRNENQEENVGNCLDDFEILRELGGGSFGCVFKVKSKKNNKLYALKRLNNNGEKDRIKNKKEIILLKRLNHENICKIFSEFIEDGVQYMVMEQYNNQDLFQYVNANKEMNKPIKEEILYNIIYQCLEGLSCIHNYGIIHCDIKLGNIFMTEEGKIVIGDFGESMVRPKNTHLFTQISNEKNILQFERKVIGSEGFIAPDIEIEGCDEMSDVYSMGATFFALLYYDIPTEENKEYYLSQPTYSNDLKNLIRKMLEPQKENRIKTNDVKDEFTKFYLQKYIKNSGFHSVTQCLLSFRNLKDTLSSNTSVSQNMDKNSNKKINVSLILTEINQETDIEKNNLELKEFFASQLKINLIENNDISPLKIVFCLINSLNNYLNKINNDGNNKSSQIKNDLNKKIKLVDEKIIKYEYYNFINSYKKLFDSIITEKCLGVFKLTWTCRNCENQYISFEKFFSITFNINSFHEQEIKILDLFKRYNQNKIQINLKKYISCQNCKKFTEQTLNKKFYSIPNNLIILFDRKGNNNSIEFKKEIKFDNQIVESSSQNPKKHLLYGIIYENYNENENSQYVPLFKKYGNWFEYKYGQKPIKIDLDKVYRQISKNIIALFYYIKLPTEDLFDNDNININNEELNNNNNDVINITTDAVKRSLFRNNNKPNENLIMNNNIQQSLPNNMQNNNSYMNNQNYNYNFTQMSNDTNGNNFNINNNSQQFYNNNMNMNQNRYMIDNSNNQLNNLQNNQSNFQMINNNNNNYNNQINQNNNNRYNNPYMNNNPQYPNSNNFQANKQVFNPMNNNISKNPNFQNVRFSNNNQNNISNQNQSNLNNLGLINNNSSNNSMIGMNNIQNSMNQMNSNINNNTQAFPNVNLINNNGWNMNNIGMNQFPNQVNNNMFNFNTFADPNNMSNMNINNHK